MRSNQITGKQMWQSLAVMVGVPSFRIFTPLITDVAGNGAPFSLLLSFGLCAGLLLFYGGVAKRHPGKSFYELNRLLFGKALGTLLSVLYLLWALFLAAFYLGEYQERISGTIFYNTSMVLFSLLLLFAVSYALKKGAATIARTGSILSYLVLGGIILFGIILVRDCRAENFLPLGKGTVLPALAGVVPALSVSVFYPIFFVFGKRTTRTGNFFPRAFLSLAASAAVSLILLAVPLGVFGEEMLSKMMVPFFAVTRNVILFNSLERLEAVLVSVILMSDFIVISILLASVLRLVGEIFKTKNKSRFIDVIIIGLFMGGLLTSVGDFRLDAFVEKLIVPVNLSFGVGIPLLWFLLGKFRKTACDFKKDLVQ